MEEHQKIKLEVCDDDYEMHLDLPDYINCSTLTEVVKEESDHTVLRNETKNATSKKIVTKKSAKNLTEDEYELKPKRGKYIPKRRTCEVCGQELSCTKSLNLHMRIHNDERPYKCDLCDKTFRQKSGLTSHMVTHSKAKPFPCPDCDGSFTTSSSLRRHQRKIHDSGKKFDCKFCPDTFFNLTSFRAHNTEKHSDIWEPRECTQCGIMLETPSISKKHLRVAHSKMQPKKNPVNNRLCVLCGIEFDTMKLYITHKYNHLQYTKEELRSYGIDHIYPCKFCNKQFSSLGIIVDHIANHMEKTHTCEICNEKFSYFLYNKHKKQIHDEVKCEDCEQVFVGKLALRSHRIKHYSQKQCHICKRILSSKHRLEMHIKSAHKIEDGLTQRNHQCVYCQEVFTTRGILSYHIVRYHRNDVKKSCDICNIKFEYHYELIRHLRRNHAKLVKGKHFLCHICNKTCSTRDALNHHIYRHNNKIGMQGKIICKECSKESRDNWDFKKHLLIHSIKYKTCRFCNVDCETVNSLSRHFSKNHAEEKMFHCNYCYLDLSTYKGMMKHRKSQTHRKKFWTFVRLHKHDFVKKASQIKQENTDGLNDGLIKREAEFVVVKTEPTEDNSTFFNSNVTDDGIKVIKSEPS